MSHAVNMPKGKAISSDLKNVVINVSNFFEREKNREFKYMLGKAEGADSGCT